MKLLNIAFWYPNNLLPKEALFIQRHIESLSTYVEYQTTVHVQVREGSFKYESYEKYGVKHKIVYLPTKSWFLIEVFSSFFTLYQLLRFKANTYDVLNFHIAYPNLTYYHLFKRFLKPMVVITEHWSAYHFNFNVKKKLPRVQRIFKQHLPVITVSEALLQDIKRFSESSFPYEIVPNVVDTTVFNRQLSISKEPYRFFMVSQWKEPKDPLTIIRAFGKFIDFQSESKLIIGGYGPMTEQMKELIDGLSLSDQVTWLGPLDSPSIAEEMNKASAYLHCSDYETFSVVCAEAISCGCFLIASKVGGIPEFVDEDKGILVDSKNEDHWVNAMEKSAVKHNFNGVDKFSYENVGKLYSETLKKWFEDR